MDEALGVIATVLLVGIGMSYLISSINYALDEQYLRIKVGGFAFRKIPISDFRDVELGVSVGGENWTNTIHMPTSRKRGVSLRRRSGLFRRLNITPNDPVDFVERVKFHPRYRPDV